MADHPVLIAAQRGLAVLTVALVATQFFLAGAGAFGATSFDAHKAVGSLLVLVVLVALLVAALARRFVGHAAALLGLTVLQLVLGTIGSDEPWVGAFHGLNALAVMGAAGTLARNTFAGRAPASGARPGSGAGSRSRRGARARRSSRGRSRRRRRGCGPRTA